MHHKYEEEWRLAAKAVKVCGPLPITFSIIVDREGLKLRGSIWTTDVDTGKKTTVNAQEELIYDEWPHPQVFMSVAQQLFLHELEESVQINDAFLYEPHKEAPRAKRRIANSKKKEWWEQ